MHPAPELRFLDELPDPTRQILASLGKPEHFAPGEPLIRKGAPETHLFLIEQGLVDIRDGAGATLDCVGPGQPVGEFAFIDNTLRSRSVVAREATWARRIERLELLRALADAPAALGCVLHTLGQLRDTRRVDTQGDARSYVERLRQAALRSRGVRHPYLDDLEAGAVPDLRFALSDFASHYFGYSNHFPRYLSTVVGRLSMAEHRNALLENLSEEAGRYGEDELAEVAACGIEPEWIEGVPHPLLFHRFSQAVGAPILAPEEEADQVVCWRDSFLSILSLGSPAEAIGALGLGTEAIVSVIYQPFVAALRRLDLAPREVVFFPLHTLVDDHHQESLAQIATDFAHTSDGRQDLRRGMLKALGLRSAFWDWLHARALDPAHADQVV